MKKIMMYCMETFFLIFIGVSIFFLNVVLHEAGHYAIADGFGLEPEIEVDFVKAGEAGFSFESVPVASTSFINNGNDEDVKLIAIGGPLVNLGLFLTFGLMSLWFRKKYRIQEILILGSIISLLSFGVNMIPISGTDGSLIFG